MDDSRNQPELETLDYKPHSHPKNGRCATTDCYCQKEVGVPILTADVNGKLLEEKELRGLAEHIKKEIEQPKCKTCGDSKKKYILDKRYKSVEYAPPEAITVIPCPDCHHPNQKLITEIEGLMSQVNEKIHSLSYNYLHQDLTIKSQALDEIDKFKTTLRKLKKAFE